VRFDSFSASFVYVPAHWLIAVQVKSDTFSHNPSVSLDWNISPFQFQIINSRWKPAYEAIHSPDLSHFIVLNGVL